MTRVALIQPIDPPQPIDGLGFSLASRFSLIDVDSSAVWRTAQEIVNGFIELIHLTDPIFNPDPRPFSIGWHLVAYVNEEGALRRLPISTAIRGLPIHGPAVFVRERVDGEGETHYACLTDADVEMVKGLIVLIAVPTEVPNG